MNKTQSLNGNWSWRRAGESAAHEGQVPGSVLMDMLRLNMIEDPFWRTNEYETRELFTQDYCYSTTFMVEQQDLSFQRIQLVFEGIDTIADIRLNGQLVASVNDMHRTYSFPVKNLLQKGSNTLEVYLHSSLNYIRRCHQNSDIFYASTGCIHGNASLRKAHSMFGWDWGPQLPDAGIFRPVFLSFANTATISDFIIRQHHTETVSLSIELAAENFSKQQPLTAQISIQAPDHKIHTLAMDIPADFESGLVTAEIENPQLWWPNGLGSQPLYTITAELQDLHHTVLEQISRRIGLRTITVSTQPDEWGREFAFVVNGEKIFAMGANYIPQDSILARVTPERHRRLVEDCAQANFNMIRIWGGGYYPDDSLYDACDEQGILVWQDLMFACNVYALDSSGEFEQNIIAETRDNVRRLRHHACLALWCGNNEMEWGWGDEWARIKGHHPRYKADYIKIFEHILSRTVKKYDSETFWWPSSPSSGGSFYQPNHPDFGDQHYWEVWHSGKPFTEYRKSHFRFASEYGFQSFPSIKTIRSFTLPEDRNIFSRVMESHQKNGMANSKIFSYVADYFLYPKDLDSIAYISQVLQLKAIQYGVEHWRQNRRRCMGSLYWQLNDCWPVASWASIDYYGRWKALHYGARRFYAPVMASAREKEELSGEITYFVHNDTLHAKQCELQVTLLDTSFNELHTERQKGTIPALSSEPWITANFELFLQDAELKSRRFARYTLTCEGKTISEGTTLFVKPKHFILPKTTYKFSFSEQEDCFTLELLADSFSHYTEISFTEYDPVLSDNYFDITSRQPVLLTIPKNRLAQNASVESLRQQLCIRSVKDSYTTEGG